LKSPNNRDLKGWVSSEEVINSQPLLDEVSRLTQENEELKQKLENAEKKVSRPSKTKATTVEFDELTKLLEATEVKVPSNLSGDDEETITDLLGVFSGQKESFITGVTNQRNSSDLMSFLYFNIAPKLQIHGLVINEKVASVMWRRFAITQKGTEFLAYLERERLLRK